MTEERWVRILCRILKGIAWFLLLVGMLSCIAIATAFTPAMFLSQWTSVVVLCVFISIFVGIYLLVKIAQMVLEIKQRVAKA